MIFFLHCLQLLLCVGCGSQCAARSLDMLRGVGNATCHHVTNELARCYVFRTLQTRSIRSSTRLSDAAKLPYLTPYSFTPREHPNPVARDIAVIGGGITGLTTAFDIARTIPDAKITLFESSHRLGGWIDSEIVQVEGGEVVFEWGPRSLRPSVPGAGWATVQLVSFPSRVLPVADPC